MEKVATCTDDDGVTTHAPSEETMMADFQDDLQSLINIHSQENGSDTPDFILAAYLNDCLKAFNVSVQARETWYGRHEVTPTTNVDD